MKAGIAPAVAGGALANHVLPALGQRERGSLGALLGSGKIGSAELVAANRWYEVFAMAEHGAVDSERSGRGGGVRLYAQERLLAATTSYRMARQALGVAGDQRMRLLLSEGLSIKGIAARVAASMAGGTVRIDPMFMCGLIVGDLGRLVDHYTAVDSRKKQRR